MGKGRSKFTNILNLDVGDGNLNPVKLETIETNLGHQPSEVGLPTHHSISITPGQLDKITLSSGKKTKKTF